MSQTQVQEHPIEATLTNLGQRWLLAVERTLPHPPQAIWAAITERDLVSRWAPFDPDRDLTETGFVALPEAGIERRDDVGSSRVDLQACKLEYSIVSPK